MHKRIDVLLMQISIFYDIGITNFIYQTAAEKLTKFIAN